MRAASRNLPPVLVINILLVISGSRTLPVAWSFLSQGGPVLRVVALASSSKSSSNTAPQQQQPPPTEAWTGTVVPGDGRMHGCTMQNVAGSLTEWIVTIDGVDADLGKFSDVVYKKLIRDATQQRFQGFRPGTVPQHLLPTYRTIAMDECAREAVLEALQQNSVRPFENCRSQLELGQFSIPPSLAKKASKTSKKRKKGAADAAVAAVESDAAAPGETNAWRNFETMKEALDAGWTPGQSFSFVALKVTGQLVKDDQDAEPVARPF